MARQERLPERNFQGYFGQPTATIDWCEANYEVTQYVAEFWNTVSNLFMIIPPLIGAYLAYKDRLEVRFVCCHMALMVVGLGSWCFHATLLYEMQLLDELPMIWGSAFLVYSLMELDGKPGRQNLPLTVFLFVYCMVVTVVYVTIKEPIFHEVAYALMVICMVFCSIRVIRKYEHSFTLFVFGLGSYALGFFIWNLDNIFCSQIRIMRESVGYPVKPALQGHAWWHVLAGTGTYLSLIFCTHARAQYLKRPIKIQMAMGVWPYARNSIKESV